MRRGIGPFRSHVPADSQTLARAGNSCDPVPGAHLRYTLDRDALAIRFVAARKIEAGEELTINYSSPNGKPRSSNHGWRETRLARVVAATAAIRTCPRACAPGSARCALLRSTVIRTSCRMHGWLRAEIAPIVDGSFDLSVASRVATSLDLTTFLQTAAASIAVHRRTMMLRTHSIATAIMCALMSGCATTYTPTVKTAHIDQARFDRDLGDCRVQAKAKYDSSFGEFMGKQSIAGASMAAVLAVPLLPVLGSALIAGTAVSGLEDDKRWKQAIVDCMVLRGYDVEEPTTVARQQAKQPGQASLPPGATDSARAMAGWNPPMVTISKKEELGVDVYAVEQLARRSGCHSNPKAVLGGKGAGWETYTVTCANGNPLVVRCEFGACRELK